MPDRIDSAAMAELEQLCAAATAGEWRVVEAGSSSSEWIDMLLVDESVTTQDLLEGRAQAIAQIDYRPEQAANAAFIAAARHEVPALIARVRQLEGVLRELADTAKIDMELNQGGTEAGSCEDDGEGQLGGWWSLRTDAAIEAARAALPEEPT